MAQKNDGSASRSSRDVLEDHLAKSLDGEVDADLATNYAGDVVILTGSGVFRGREGMAECWRQLRREVPDASFQYRTKLVEGEVAFLEWTAASPAACVRDGADSFLIRSGLIVAQTIHYTAARRGMRFTAAYVHTLIGI